jgi:hypothetical protein
MVKTNKIEMGITGEYYTAAKLSSMNYRVSMALGNNKDFDLYVSNGENAKMIQVKTTGEPKAIWVVNKHIKANPNLVYVFVNLNLQKEDGSCPNFHIVPSDLVKKYFDDIDEICKKNGTYNPDRKSVDHFEDTEGKYLDKWELLDLPIILEQEDE